MTVSELMSEIGRVLPNATIGEDSDGQLIINTGTALVNGDELAEIPEPTLETLPAVRDCDRLGAESALEAMNAAMAAGRLIRVMLYTDDGPCRVAVAPGGVWINEEVGPA